VLHSGALGWPFDSFTLLVDLPIKTLLGSEWYFYITLHHWRGLFCSLGTKAYSLLGAICCGFLGFPVQVLWRSWPEVREKRDLDVISQPPGKSLELTKQTPPEVYKKTSPDAPIRLVAKLTLLVHLGSRNFTEHTAKIIAFLFLLKFPLR